MACNQGLPSVKNICGPQLNDTRRLVQNFLYEKKTAPAAAERLTGLALVLPVHTTTPWSWGPIFLNFEI